jgi:hypothetical protein
VQLAIRVQVRAAVSDVEDTVVRQAEGHRHRHAHAAQRQMLGRFLENAGVRLPNRRLELRKDPAIA